MLGISAKSDDNSMEVCAVDFIGFARKQRDGSRIFIFRTPRYVSRVIQYKLGAVKQKNRNILESFVTLKFEKKFKDDEGEQTPIN